jgi:hypothetical protein
MASTAKITCAHVGSLSNVLERTPMLASLSSIELAHKDVQAIPATRFSSDRMHFIRRN